MTVRHTLKSLIRWLLIFSCASSGCDFSVLVQYMCVAVILQIKQEKKLKQSILNGGSRASGSEVSAGQQTCHVCIAPFVVIVAYYLHQRRRLFLGSLYQLFSAQNQFPGMSVLAMICSKSVSICNRFHAR